MNTHMLTHSKQRLCPPSFTKSSIQQHSVISNLWPSATVHNWVPVVCGYRSGTHWLLHLRPDTMIFPVEIISRTNSIVKPLRLPQSRNIRVLAEQRPGHWFQLLWSLLFSNWELPLQRIDRVFLLRHMNSFYFEIENGLSRCAVTSSGTNRSLRHRIFIHSDTILLSQFSCQNLLDQGNYIVHRSFSSPTDVGTTISQATQLSWDLHRESSILVPTSSAIFSSITQSPAMPAKPRISRVKVELLQICSHYSWHISLLLLRISGKPLML
jgi:hypothetical protein